MTAYEEFKERYKKEIHDYTLDRIELMKLEIGRRIDALFDWHLQHFYDEGTLEFRYKDFLKFKEDTNHEDDLCIVHIAENESGDLIDNMIKDLEDFFN